MFCDTGYVFLTRTVYRDRLLKTKSIPINQFPRFLCVFLFFAPPRLRGRRLFFFCILCCNTALAEDTRQTLTDQRDQAQQAYKEAQQALEQMKSEQQQTQSQIEDLQGQAADIAGQLDAIYAALQEADRQLLERQADEQAAKKAFEEASEALDAFVRAQSDRYTTQDLVLTSLDFRCPLDSYSSITTQFGEADPWGIPHRGTDFAAPNGTPIYAVAAGVISAAGPVNSYGNCVQVSHGTASDGNRYDSLYAHMSRIAVSQGQTVEKGQIIGYVGNTGNVYGANGGYHLHLELRVNGGRVNPLAYLPC